MIRLVKNKTFRKPSALLIDLNMPDYNNASQGNEGVVRRYGSSSSSDVNDPNSMKALINQLASSNLKEMGISTTGTEQRNNKKKEKSKS